MPCFTYPWHFHPEFEILYVIDGFGTSYVADNIKSFQSGDLALLGSNLPHFWKSDQSYLESEGNLKVKYIVIQFPHDFFSDAGSKLSRISCYRKIAETIDERHPVFARNLFPK